MDLLARGLSANHLNLSNLASGDFAVSSSTSSTASSSAPFSTYSEAVPDASEGTAGRTSERNIRRERRLIGIVLEQDEQLPRNVAERGRSRRLGLMQLV